MLAPRNVPVVGWSSRVSGPSWLALAEEPNKPAPATLALEISTAWSATCSDRIPSELVTGVAALGSPTGLAPS